MVHARILEYGRDMGIDKALLTASFAVPNELVRFLERDELVRFGIDRREFGETVWHFRNKPTIAIQKRFFVHADGGEQSRYLNGFVSLQCGGEQEIRLAFAQERDSSEQKSADPLPVRINFSGQGIVLRNQVPSRQFDMHWISLSPDMFDFFGRGADIKVSGIDRGRNDGSPGSVTLNMDGFSDASVKLRKSCDELARNANGRGAADKAGCGSLRSRRQITAGAESTGPAEPGGFAECTARTNSAEATSNGRTHPGCRCRAKASSGVFVFRLPGLFLDRPNHGAHPRTAAARYAHDRERPGIY